MMAEGRSRPSAGYNEDQAAFMRDQVGLDLDGFPHDHEFLEDYGLEEENECDIEREPLFEDELANQAVEPKPKRKSKRTKAYTAAEDKFLYECWRDIGQDHKTGAEQKHSTFWICVHRDFHERKKFPPYQIDSREEKRRQEIEDQMKFFMEIQRRRLDMEAENKARMLEMEAEMQAKMLEIEAANAKTKAKEVALTSMMTGMEIMKVDLNTMSPRKRPWFEKIQADMLKFDDE
ncbi:hypothetical protein VPH35_031485 [Triticum aestivum]